VANSNTLTSVLDRILAAALPVLRQNCVMPRLVNSSYSSMAGNQGSTLEISVAGSVSANAVTASNTPPDSSGVTPTVVTMNLDKWYDAGFFMSDKDKMDIRDGVLPAQAEACVKALANQVNSDLLALYKGVYGYVGTAATTPFSTGLDAAANARKVLATQLAPLADRRGVIDPNAEANFILLPAVLNANQRGDNDGIKEGRISRILGIDWFTDQAVPTHTTGAVGTVLVDLGAGYTAAATSATSTVHVDGMTTSASVGDVLTFANHSQTYTVVSATNTAGNDYDLVIAPGLQAALVDDEAVTFKASHVANLAFCRDAFGFANRPFNGGGLMGASVGNFSYMTDPVSSLSLRVEVTREHKRDKLAFDILYGVKCIRPELAVRIAG
jgi:hypothetical protein